MTAARVGDADRLTRVVERFRRQRVAVVGDIVADEFVFGDIDRVSREAPVLILRHLRTESVPGGGGNAIANLCALGARVHAVGAVGRDASGDRVLDQLAAVGCRTSGILRIAGHVTPTKSRILAGGVHTRRQQIVRLDRGAERTELDRDVGKRLRRALDRALGTAQGLLVADYGYGAASPAIARPAIGALGRRGLPVTVDSRGRVAAFRGMTACTPNQEEVERALGLESLDGPAALDRAGRALRERAGADAVLITRGAQGMSLYERRRRPVHIPAYGSDEVADVTGAGDTVIAVFTLALIADAGAADAARLANYAAGLVVTKMGTATVGREELIGAVREDLA
jgi:rfaE bifunctional protein kinase chain/domain